MDARKCKGCNAKDAKECWIGIGWVTERTATPADKERLPKVI